MDPSEFQELLNQNSELEIQFFGRKTGNRYDAPVWFVHDSNRIYLLPVKGSQSNWYKNILRNPSAKISISGKSMDIIIKPVSEKKLVEQIIEKFYKKYGKSEIDKYYSILDVAAEVEISE
jgi:deazaflavin-dependent oxidoreductase (nitroreductase family)